MEQETRFFLYWRGGRCSVQTRIKEKEKHLRSTKITFLKDKAYSIIRRNTHDNYLQRLEC